MTNFDKMERTYSSSYRRRVNGCGWGIAPIIIGGVVIGWKLIEDGTLQFSKVCVAQLQDMLIDQFQIYMKFVKLMLKILPSLWYYLNILYNYQVGS